MAGLGLTSSFLWDVCSGLDHKDFCLSACVCLPACLPAFLFVCLPVVSVETQILVSTEEEIHIVFYFFPQNSAAGSAINAQRVTEPF